MTIVRKEATVISSMHFDEHEYYVYILANRSCILYLGVTNSLIRRIKEHRESTADGFTAKYKIHRLVYFERFQYINNAIAREKHLKHFTRQEKIDLVESTNPTWEDLAAEYFYQPAIHVSNSNSASQ